MEKRFLIDGNELTVILGRGVVRIDNNKELWDYIRKNPLKRTKKLVERIQEDYTIEFGKKFQLSDNSFIMEIWGHLYFEWFLVRNEKLGKFLFPFGLYNRLLISCETTDCGESGIDKNRWLWDLLAVFTPLVGWLIPKNNREKAG